MSLLSLDKKCICTKYILPRDDELLSVRVSDICEDLKALSGQLLELAQ